ncbi:helix-turn-helix transcriptional regulator [Ensifer sp. 4252]|uniref:helix-turn-helix transcriptional regulator n=1 Tax=Ensifer sp. 4252 TaxID=3373915 RepID=UPI003D1BC90E
MFQAGKASTEELTDLIYGSVFGECSWQDFLNRLATTMPNGKSSLHYQDVISPNAHVPYSSGFTGDDIDRYHAHFFAVNPWMAKAMLVPLGVGVRGEDMLARDRLVRSEFYNDFLKGQTGCETSVGMTIIREKGRSFILSTYTSSTDADLNGRAASQLTALAPHLKRAFDFVRKRDVMTADQHSGQSLFDAIGVGLIYAGENGCIRSMNESAQRLAAAGAAVRITPNGRIGLDCPQTSAALDHMSLRANTQARPHISIVKTDDGTAYRVTLVRLKSDIFTEFLNGPTVAVLIEPATSLLPEMRRAHLKEIHGLTPAEIRIASSLAAGLSLREIAQANGVGYETIRTQLKSIYAKTEVNSQAALVSLLMR